MLIQRLLNGSMPAAPDMAFTLIDVRDVAALHVAAMISPAGGGHRFPSGNGTFSFMEIAAMLRPAFPAYVAQAAAFPAPNWLVRILGLFDKDVRGNLGELGVFKRGDASDAAALLGRPFIPANEAVIETARSLIAQKLV